MNPPARSLSLFLLSWTTQIAAHRMSFLIATTAGSATILKGRKLHFMGHLWPATDPGITLTQLEIGLAMATTTTTRLWPIWDCRSVYNSSSSSSAVISMCGLRHIWCPREYNFFDFLFLYFFVQIYDDCSCALLHCIAVDIDFVIWSESGQLMWDKIRWRIVNAILGWR